MSRFFIVTVLIFGICALSVAAAENKSSKEDIAIRQTLDSYIKAFNSNDATALSHLWAEDARYEDETGEVYKGRKEIQGAFNQFFGDNKGIAFKMSISKVNISSPTHAAVEGTSTVSLPGEEESESDFTAEFVNKDGKWLIASVGEAPDSSNYHHLTELEWLIGEWADEKNAGQVETIAQWTANKNFITVSFAIQTNEIDVEGTQIIGWDPVNKAIKSWTFDSNGSFAEGVWTKNGSRWQVRVSRIFSDGAKGSETNIYEPVNKNTFVWSTSTRVDNGQQLPNIDGIKIIRKQSEKN
ncbi:MAG: YybH family protein [Desulfomonilaceae bacterium]